MLKSPSQLEATGALEELLLLQRSFISHALYPLGDETTLVDLLEHFQSTILSLQNQEPSFWHLQVVKFVRSVLQSRVGACIDAAVSGAASEEQQDRAHVVVQVKAQVKTSSELEATLSQVQSDVEKEVKRLEEALNAHKENQLTAADTDEHFVVTFLEKLQSVVELREKQLKLDEEGTVEDIEQGLRQSCSYERLTFDGDLNDMSGSAMSFLCMEDFPSTIRRIQSTDPVERATGLDELMQMPILEIIHSGPLFPAACSAIVGLFLDVDIYGERCGSAESAKKLVYDLMSQVEDATQFLELFWTVVDFMGSHLETGELFLYRQDICEGTDVRSIAVLDCFRVLHTLLGRVMIHWVYFAPDALAKLLHSTFRLLTMYSKAEIEVETKRVNPFMVLCLIDNHSVRWFKLWLLNAPSTRQLFAAIDDSGFLADLLQHLSRLRPLASIKTSNSSTDAIKKRTVRCALSILAYTCEYRQGRELVTRWQRLPVHTYIKQRHTTWERPVLEMIATENELLYRIVQLPISEEDPCNTVEKAEYEHLGTGVFEALILSVATIMITLPKCLQDGTDVSYHKRWVTCISSSVATCLHSADLDPLLAALAKLVDACWADHSSKISFAPTEMEENKPWFPFRQPRNVTEVYQLVVDSVAKRTRRGILSTSELHSSGQLILRTLISSKAVADTVTHTPNSDTTRLIFELCKRYLQSRYDEAMPSSEQRYLWTCDPHELLELITDIVVIPQAFKVAGKLGIIDELWKACNFLSDPSENQSSSRLNSRSISALYHSAAGVRDAQDRPIANAYPHNQLNDLATLSFRELLGCLSFPTAAKTFFDLVGFQATISQTIAEVRVMVEFTVALNSRDDECPAQLITPARRLQWLRCCLSSQFASSSLLSSGASPLVKFISDTVAAHTAGFCVSSCHAEDICCVAFQLILSLVSSVPSMLECSNLLSKLKLLDLNDKCALQRDLLCDTSEILGPCSFLEKQLCYEFEFIGGPSEKLSQCELFAFDAHTRQITNIPKDLTGEKTFNALISEYASTLQSKILQAIKDGVEADSSTPMDFVLISQASWELINDLEIRPVNESPFVSCKSAGSFTAVFANLLYELVMSKRSRLESPAKPSMDEADLIPATDPTHSSYAFFPTDSEQKLMNRLYKNYANDLSLDSSPTLLHCIVKTFGKVAIDSFPVTSLMVLYPSYGEVDILRFLSHCFTSPWAGFLWPRSVCRSGNRADGNSVASPATAISEAVEIIMEREFPQVLQVIDQCHGSLLSLVLRWHSQNFWNYFDWENVVIYTYFSVLYGAEFQVYIIVAILKHLEPTMRDLTAKHSSQSLAPFLTLIREPIRSFRFSPWRTLLLRLRSNYHEEVEVILYTSV